MTCLHTYFFVVLSLINAVTGFRFRVLISFRNRETVGKYSSSSFIPYYLMAIRGGEVQIVTSTAEVESMINEASAQNQLVVLDFAANNCPPCEMIAPIYHDLSDLDEFKNVLFLKVNVNNHPTIVEKYGVDGWPTFILFKQGQMVDRIVGGQAAKAGLYSLIAKYKNA